MDKTAHLPDAVVSQPPALEVQPLNDRETITAIREGDSSAFDLLVQKYENRVFHHCLRMVGDREESTDLTQEVFLKVFRNIHKYEHGYAFYTWLYRITVNCCIDHFRNSKRKIKKIPLSQLDGRANSDNDRDQDIPDEKFGPELNVMNTELRDMLNTAVGNLSESLRSTIILKEIEGFSYAEISEISECSIGTVKSRMHRAREELRDVLTPYM